MKRLSLLCFLPCFLLAPAAQAENLACPKLYPSATEKPQRLMSAGVSIGEIGGGGDLHGDIKESRAGRTVSYLVPIGPKWLVCMYGQRYEHKWWQKLDDGISECTLVVKDNARDEVTARLSCK